jgi:ABC-type transport system involved in cytochrome bd biosynthesis fused ATPase/permease subunit
VAGLAAHAEGSLDGVMLAVLAFVAMATLDQVAALPAALAGITAGDAAAQGLAELEGMVAPAPEPAFDRSPAAAAVTAALAEVTVQRPGGEAPILDGVTLEAEPGTRIAIVGPSGSGKTTLLHTLLHFIEPTVGSATLDRIDVRAMTRSGLARHVGWLPEETHLFAASLRDNLRLACPSAADDDCIAALDRVGLSPWYGSLPDGLDTRLGAGARPLSAGERQRIGLARLMLSQASVLLLDEPTSHLDPASSPSALAALLGNSGRRAVLVVGHESDGAGPVDRIIQLETGRLVDPESRPPQAGCSVS